MKTKRGHALHHLIPHFSTNDCLASFQFLQLVYKNFELCHCMFMILDNGSKIIYMFYSMFIKNAKDFYTMYYKYGIITIACN
jgi:hypothetical protein